MTKKVDKPFLVATLILIILGFVIFSSASLGLLAKGGERYSNVALSQTFFGLFLGTLCLIVVSRIPYQFWKKNSFYIFGISLVITCLVFIDGLGFEHGGARRWLDIGPFSFQPSEFLKIAFILYLSAWLSSARNKIDTFKQGMLPILVLLTVVALIILSQPDTDVFIIIALTCFSMFLIAGGKWRHLIPVFIVFLLGIVLIASVRPYVKQRITTFLNPSENNYTSSYQSQQALIAIGSGGIAGRGFGQSIQKFNFLPEPMGDSIFAVAGEEFGFLGTLFLVLLFVYFAIRGLKIAARTEDMFGRLLVVGVVLLITFQAFLNMGAMLGILPLAGNPLPFVSQGGTSLLFTLIGVGIVLNVSKGQKLQSK